MIISFCGHSSFYKTQELEEQLLSILETQVGDAKADLVIAYIDQSFGGAYKIYQHAKRKKKTVINLGKLDK